MTDKLLTTAETAQRLRVASETLYRWRKAGKGPPWLLVGGKCLYPANELQQFLEEQRPVSRRETTP